MSYSREMELLFVLSNQDRNIHVFEFENDTEVAEIDRFTWRQEPFENNAQSHGITWVDMHPEGQLWITAWPANHAYQLSIDTDDWSITEINDRFAWGGNQTWDGIAHDGYNLWLCGYNQAEYLIIDDGVFEVYWLSYEPVKGELDPNEEMNVVVTIDTDELIEGVYCAELFFLNEEDDELAVVEIELITVGSAQLEANWDPGFPDLIDYNEQYDPDLFVGGPFHIGVTIENAGSAELIIESISFAGDADEMFSVEPTDFTIAPRNEQMITVIFDAPDDEADDYQVEMTITSNDSENEETVVNVRANAGLPPVIELAPVEIETNIETGQIIQRPIEIGNEGHALLRFETEIEITDEPDWGCVPRRDDINFEGKTFAVFQDAGAWGWLSDGMLERDLLVRDHYQSYRNADNWNNVNFNDFDAIIIAGNNQSANFINEYNRNLERLCEYIDDGGAAYYESGNMNSQIRPPGGFTNNQRGAVNGVLTVSPERDEENYCLFAEICHETQPDNWEEGEIIEGNSFLYSGYPIEQFNEALDEEVIIWYERIAVPQGQQYAGVVSYGYGDGAVMLVGHNVGHCWINWAQEGQWGSISAEILYYLTKMSSGRWLSVVPSYGEIEVDADPVELDLILDADHLYEGDYEAEVHFLSNDPAFPDEIVLVTIHVTPLPDLLIEWEYGMGENGYNDEESILDWNLYYGADLFVEYEYQLPVTLINDGTTTLTVSDIYSTEEHHFNSDFDDDIVLEAEEETVVNLLFRSDETGEFPENDDVRMIFCSDDPDEEEITIRLHAQSYDPPVIVLDTDGINENMYGGEHLEITINIANRGDEALNWETEVEFIDEDRDSNQRSLRSASGGNSSTPRRDETGDEIARINSQVNQYKAGIAYNPDNELMYLTSYTTQRIEAISFDDNYGNLEQVQSWQAGSAMGAGWLNGVLYTVIWANNSLTRFDAEGQNLGAINLPTRPTAVTTSQENGWVMIIGDLLGYDLLVYEIDGNDVEEVGRLNWHNDGIPAQSRSCCWVDLHPDQQLWINTPNHIWNLNVDTDEWQAELAQDFAFDNRNDWWSGIGHDSRNLWLGPYQLSNYFIIDDGVTEFRWLTWEPAVGTVPGGENTDMIVTIITAGLETADYEAILHILSNDPGNPDVEIPVNINVQGIANIDITPGGDELDDAPLDFGICYIGYSEVLQFTVENVGTESLEVEGVYFIEGTGYSIDDDIEFVLDPGGDPIVIEVVFEPPEGNRMYEENIGFITNDPRYPFDPREEQFGYPLHVIGNGLIRPEIQIRRNALEINVASGDLDEAEIRVQNIGGSPLIFETEVIIIDEPDRDTGTSRNLRSVENAAGPRRDDPPRGRFACFMDRVAWGGDLNQLVWSQIEDFDYDYLHQNDFADFNIDDYDCIWVCHSEQTDAYNTAYNQQRERFEEWVDAGGVYYASTGTEQYNVVPVHPGGVRYTIGNSMNGRVVVQGQDVELDAYNYLADLMNWRVGTQLEGNSWIHVYYEENQFENLENSRDYQIIAVGEDNNNPGIVVYNYGRGTCIVSGTTDGYLHYRAPYNQPPNWGSAGEELIYYMDYLSISVGGNWLSVDPPEASIEAEQELAVILSFNGNRLIEGDYEAEIHFLSNDPVEPDMIVDVTMHIFSRPMLGRDTDPHPVEWGGEAIQFEPVIAGEENASVFTISLANGGLDDIEIEGMRLERNQEFEIDLNENQFVIPSFEVFDLDIVFHSERAGEFSDRLTFFSNAQNDEFNDGIFHYELTGRGLTHPVMTIEPDEIQADILLNDEEVPRSFIIGNDADRWGADLSWRISVNIIEEEEHNGAQRNLRSTNGVYEGANEPRRDQPEGRGILIQNQCLWAAFDFERYFVAIDGFEYDRYRSWDDVEDVDLSDYDFMWIGNYEQEAWVRDYNENLERIEEFVDGGGALYHSSGSNLHNTRPINPGGLTYHWGEQDGDQSQNNCPLQLNPEDNFLINYMNENDPYDWEWGQGHRLVGNGCAHGVFYEDELNEIENCDWWQIMAVGNPVDEPIIVTYNYGRGYCVVSTTKDGFLHNNPASYHWGRTGEAMIWYLDYLCSPGWIKVSPKSGDIPANEEMEITVTFTAVELENYTTYEAELLVESNDPENPEVVIPVTLETGTRLIHFNTDNFDDFIQTRRFHTLNIIEFLVEDNPVPDGWEIGVFAEGEDIENNLCGATVWVDGGRTMQVFGDDPGTDRIEGFIGGDQMNFRAWDPDAGENGVEWRASVEFTDGPRIWVNHAESDLIITAHPVTQQILELTDGWNLISLNIVPDIQYWNDESMLGPNMRLMIDEFKDDRGDQRLTQLKDERGDFCNPEWDFFGVRYWNAGEGYAIKVLGDLQLTYIGAQIDAQTEIPLETGWNYVAYYPTYELPCDLHTDFYALSSIIDHVIVAKDENGNFLVWEWDFGELTFSPGNGYQILVDEDVVLTYPEEWQGEAALISVFDSHRTLEKHWTPPVSTSENMSVLITSVNGYLINDGDQIAAFNDEQLVGTGSFKNGKCGFAVWGDDKHTGDVVEGLKSEQSFDLKLWDADRGIIVDLEVTALKYGDGLTYKTDGFTVLDMKVVEALPEEFSLSQNYPNPFNSATRLAYDLPEAANVTISVFDVGGRSITNLVNRKHNAGRYTVVWNADNISSGIYVIRMTADDYTAVRKVMLVR
ncbi:MAG: T9SS type A sorting domain-containing protein [Calditrichaeota bacterium]|nr:T9SS type A sorting domain-containing protein [Calditrichota bacterium]